MKVTYEFGYLYLEGKRKEEGKLLERLVSALNERYGVEMYDVSTDEEYFLYGSYHTMDYDNFLERNKTCNRIIGQWNRNHR